VRNQTDNVSEESTTGSSGAAAATTAVTNLGNVTTQVVGGFLDLRPTITVDQGTRYTMQPAQPVTVKPGESLSMPLQFAWPRAEGPVAPPTFEVRETFTDTKGRTVPVFLWMRPAVQRTIAHLPRGQRAVLTVAGGVVVRAGLDRAPVLPESHSHSVYPVHDPLVVRGRSVLVQLCESLGLDDLFDDILPWEGFPGHMLDRDTERGHSQTLGAKVRKDANCYSTLA
jgi:hypothetical protein